MGREDPVSPATMRESMSPRLESPVVKQEAASPEPAAILAATPAYSPVSESCEWSPTASVPHVGASSGDLDAERPEDVTFSPKADTLVLCCHSASGEIVRYVVNKQVVEACSAVFEHVALGPVDHATDMPDSSIPSISQQGTTDAEDPTALMILFAIMHCRFELVPGGLPRAVLCKLAKLARKYHCVGLLRPWAKSWCSSIDIGTSASHKILSESMWIAWEMGDERLFAECARHLTSRSIIKDRKLVDEQQNGLEDDGLPTGVAGKSRTHPASSTSNANFTSPEAIGMKRVELIDSVLRSVDGPITDLQNETVPHVDGADCTHGCCLAANEESTACHFMILGSSIVQLRKHGLWPLPCAASFAGTVKKLSATLENLTVQGFPEYRTAPHMKRHQNCGLPTPRAIREIDLVPDMTAPMKEHLSARAKLTGLQ